MTSDGHDLQQRQGGWLRFHLLSSCVCRLAWTNLRLTNFLANPYKSNVTGRNTDTHPIASLAAGFPDRWSSGAPLVIPRVQNRGCCCCRWFLNSAIPTVICWSCWGRWQPTRNPPPKLNTSSEGHLCTRRKRRPWKSWKTRSLEWMELARFVRLFSKPASFF